MEAIAITGIGLVSPLGHDTQSTWDALLAGKSGVAPIQGFDASRFPTTIASEVKKFNAQQVIQDRKLLNRTVPFVHFALAAADQALDDAGIRPTETTAERWGLVAGSGMMTSEFQYWEKFQPEFATEGKVTTEKMPQELNWFNANDFCKAQANAGLGVLLARYNIRGYANSVHTACASGGQAMGLALQAMRRGESDAMLVGGFDSMINPIGLSSFCLLGALSTYNDTPETASRPFDLTRNGFVLGEGAAFMVLEPVSKAKARGATIYAELSGEGNSLSAYRITDSHPSGDGPIQALAGALNDAGVSIDDVDYINAHGTSTKMNDQGETNAIKAVFGERAKKIPTSSTKSLTGHLIAAAGTLEAAVCALAIHHGQVPMTANLTTPDPECDLDYVTEGARKVAVNVAVSNSFGFGGSNSCIVLKKSQG